MLIQEITDQRLKDCLLGSKRFQAIPAEEQSAYIERMLALSAAYLDQLCTILEEENIKEKMEADANASEQVKIMNGFLAELQEMISNLQRKIREGEETVSVNEDQKSMDELLKSLE